MGRVRLYATLRMRAGDKCVVDVPWAEGDAVAGVLRELVRREPGLDGFILDEEGRLLPYIIVFVDGRDIRHLNGLDTRPKAEAEISIFPPVAGGRA